MSLNLEPPFEEGSLMKLDFKGIKWKMQIYTVKRICLHNSDNAPKLKVTTKAGLSIKDEISPWRPTTI